jgi:hypothetical protein
MVLDDIISGLLEQLINILLYAILYPLYLLFSMLVHWIMIIVDPFVLFIQALYGIFYSLFSFFVTLYQMFPEPYGAIFSIILTVVVSLRVYSFLKDISILGNKV